MSVGEKIRMLRKKVLSQKSTTIGSFKIREQGEHGLYRATG